MKTYLITGGTNGIGKGLAQYYLAKGDRVIIVGRSKGDLEGAIYIQADLSLVSENYKLIEIIKQQYGSVHGLILCASLQTYRKQPLDTLEGFELTFALSYLSRYVLSYQIPIINNGFILNVAAPGMKGAVDFDNLEYRKNFKSMNAMFNGSRLNDLLGTGFERDDVHYILYNPMAVRTPGAKTAFKNPFLKAFANFTYLLIGKDIEEAVKPIISILENPIKGKFAAFKAEKPVDLTLETFDVEKAAKLKIMTQQLLEQLR